MYPTAGMLWLDVPCGLYTTLLQMWLHDGRKHSEIVSFLLAIPFPDRKILQFIRGLDCSGVLQCGQKAELSSRAGQAENFLFEKG